MPSPSPTSRRSSSSAASRNYPGSSRADLLTPRGLQQSFFTTSSNSAASRALHENMDDHKENSTENGNSRGAPVRSNQSQKGPSKKPWVTHFAKPATTLSPTNRVLVDRNSSCSPVRLGSTASGNGETLSDKKVAKPTTPRGREEAPGKGVAELSKRIQQFLEDQNVLLGVKTGSSNEVTSTCASVTPVEPGQRPLSSPYNPYNSPFFERPKFLRLNGNISSMEEADIVVAPTDGTDMVMEPPTEELPLFEGDQILVTPLQQIQFSTSLSASSNEDEEVRLEENDKEQMFEAVTVEEASVDALGAKVLPLFGSEKDCPHKLKAEVRKARSSKLPVEDADTGMVQALNQFQDGENQQGEVNVAVVEVTVQEASVDALGAKVLPISGGEVDCPHELKAEVRKKRMGKLPEEDAETGMVQALNQFRDGENQQAQINVAVIEVKDVTVNGAPQEGFLVCQDEDQNLSLETAKIIEDGDAVDGDAVSWGRKAVRVMFCGALLATFLTLVLLSSASSGLLPPSLVNNPVNSFWQSSKYHKHSMMLMGGLDGLWSTETVYFPADAHVSVLRGANLVQAISELFNQAHQELQLYVQVAASMVDDWRRVLVQQISVSMNPDTAIEHKDRARQFEWIQEYEFEEEWVDKLPKLAYTDWELLYEYDLGAANQFVLGSIPESLKNDLLRNFSQLSGSPEVRDLLEDLMKLKGGSTEEDRLEVLQYFWEYRRFSASAHESLMKIQLETTAINDGSKTRDFSTSSDHEFDPENVEMDHDQGQQMIQFTEHIDENHYQTPTEQHSELFEDVKQHLDDLAEHLLEKMGIEQEQIVNEMRETASEKLQESMVYDNSQTHVSTATLELQREVIEDISSTDIQLTQPKSDVRLDIAQLTTLATFIVASFFILGGRNRQSSNVAKLISHASSVQFLRKFDQPLNSVDDDAQQNGQPFADVKQDKKQVKMIEELNDRFASVLQSPEPNNLHLRSPHARKDEDLIRSPIPTSTTSSPYGSFTTYKRMPKKEGQATTETKLTPVRRSSRIRNHVSMSPTPTPTPNANAVKRIAISPP